jgi:hypothetical protein
MQGPPTPHEEAEASIPTETVIPTNGPNLERAFTVRRKAAKRTALPPQNLAVPLSIPARKKPRLEEPLAT